jgi:hypothetical protein
MAQKEKSPAQGSASDAADNPQAQRQQDHLTLAETQDSAGAVIAVIGPSTFDYSSLPGEVKRDLQAAAARVKKLGKTVVGNIIEIGKELGEAKTKLGGRFCDWIKDEFGMSHTTALNYMRVASRFARTFATVANLPPATLYRLAAPSTPIDTVNEVVALVEHNPAAPSIERIESMVANARAEARESKKLAKLTPQARKREAERKAKMKADAERRDQEHKKAQEDAAAAVTEIAAILRERLGDDLDHVLALCRTAGAGHMSLADLVQLLEVEPPDEAALVTS